MSTPIALLVGGSFSAIPFLQILKQEGYRVIVAGKDQTEPCHALADDSLFVDYSDKEALLAACAPIDIDCVIPTCNDYSYLSSTYVSHKLGLSGFDIEDVALTLHTKQKFKQFSREYGLKSPQPISWESLSQADKEEVAKQRLITKPDDAFSGIGVSVSSNIEALEAAISQATCASRNGKFVVEYFFDGSLHSHSCFLRNGRIVDEFLVDEFCTLNTFQVNSSTYPSSLCSKVLQCIHEEVEKLASKLTLTDGLLHTQFLWNGTDIQIVECMRRCPGDLYGRQMELSHGYPYHFNVIAPYLRREFRSMDQHRDMLTVARHTIGSTDIALVSAVRIKSLASQIEFVPLKRSGDTLSGDRTDKAGILFFIYDHEYQRGGSTGDYRDYVSLIPSTRNLASEVTV